MSSPLSLSSFSQAPLIWRNRKKLVYEIQLATLSFSLAIYILSGFLTIFTFPSVAEDEKEFSYEVDSENGPAHWGDIHKEWSACGKGEMQSPIDLTHERVQVVHHLRRLRRTYRPANATMKNRGHDIMVIS